MIDFRPWKENILDIPRETIVVREIIELQREKYEWVIQWSVSSTDHNVSPFLLYIIQDFIRLIYALYTGLTVYNILPALIKDGFVQNKSGGTVTCSVDCTMSITSTSIRTVEKLAVVSVERNNQAVSPKAMGDTTPIIIGRTCGECCLYDIETTLVPSCILFPPIFFYLIHGHVGPIGLPRNQY